MKIEDVLLLCGIIALVSFACNLYLLVNYLYHKKVIDKIRKLCIKELIDPEAIIECCEPMLRKEQCQSVSSDGCFTCNRRKGHEGIHIATDFFKILSIWKESDALHPVDCIPESEFEETQKIPKSWSFNHRRGN